MATSLFVIPELELYESRLSLSTRFHPCVNFNFDPFAAGKARSYAGKEAAQDGITVDPWLCSNWKAGR